MSQLPESLPGRAGQRLPWAVPWLALLALIALNLFFVSRVMPIDDAYITYRVARNLAQGAGPVFNPGERVLSITTPGYALLLAAASWISRDTVALGLAFSGLAMAAIGLLLADLSRPARPGQGFSQSLTWLRATVAIALTLSLRMVAVAVGMETTLYVAALLATFSAYRRAWQAPTEAAADGWLLWTAAAASAAFLIRPDGALAGVVVAAHWLVVRRRVPWRALGLALLLCLPWLLFAWAYYGSPVPNTLAAKVTQGIVDDPPRWAPQLWTTAVQWRSVYPAAALLAAVGLAAAFLQRNGLRWLLLLWAALYVALHALLDVRGYPWYYVPLAPVAALLAADGVAAIAGWVHQALARSARLAAGPWPRFAATLVALGLAFLSLWPVASIAANLSRATGPRAREAIYQRTGELLRQLCLEDPARTLGTAEIGVLGYLSDCRVVDFSGLLQRDLAHLALPPAEKIEFAIKRYQPSLVVLTGNQEFIDWYAQVPWFHQRYQALDLQEQDQLLSALFVRRPGPANALPVGAGWWRQTNTAETVSLVFADSVRPEIALHAYLPAGSRLVVAANGEPLVELQGEGDGWRDYSLPAVTPDEAGRVTLTLLGTAGDQPAAVAWIESNAVPAVHRFAPSPELLDEAMPAAAWESGASARALLAPAYAGPAALVDPSSPAYVP